MILLVEDNSSDEFLTLRALEKRAIDAQVKIVRDGQEALDYLFCEGKYIDRPAQNPQVILLDIKLPRIDGLEVLEKIRATSATQSIPVIILTSSKEQKEIEKGHIYGANHYLFKPINIDKLSAAISQFYQ